MRKFVVMRTLLLVASVFSSVALAQAAQPRSLHEAAQAAVLKNPEVQVRWHAFRDASEEVGVARGGYLPKLDFSAGSGRQKIEQKDVGTDLSYHGNERSLTLRQMLFDGFATSSEVKRLGKARLVRYFELLDASENTALEAGRAYLDVLRYRAHVELAEDNYLQHQAAHEQLKRRADSGVGKRVDVDQAASRLALADINLTTAYANLHDVTARYVRLVGEQPNKAMASPKDLDKALPPTASAALAEGLKKNPALRASIENTEAAQHDLEGRRAAFMPKLDLVARRDGYSNYQDAGNRDESRVELRVNFNLFNGGSDLARNRQYRERKDMALDLREKACRDMRQTLSIGYNETIRLTDQLSYLDTQVRLVEKTRTAYRDQFNIGQRTLLDLLNTQNEYFDARRAQVNADADLAIAYLRSYAGMGRLLEVLGLKRIDVEQAPEESELAPVNLAEMCPNTTPADTTLDREALKRKVQEMLDGQRGSFIGARPQGQASTPTPAASETTGPESVVVERITAWGKAWASRDVAGYLDFYAADFKPEGEMSRENWARQREQRIARSAAEIRIDIQNLVVSLSDPDNAVASFRQVYASGGVSDTTEKTLEWRRENGQWRIMREATRPFVAGSR